MKINVDALKQMSVAGLKILGWGLFFSVFVGASSLVTSPFGLIGGLGNLALVAGGVCLFYPPIKKNFNKIASNAKIFNKDLKASKSNARPTRSKAIVVGQYTIFPDADKSIKSFLQKQEKAKQKADEKAQKRSLKEYQKRQEEQISKNYGHEPRSFWQGLKSAFVHDTSRDVFPPAPDLMKKENKEKREKFFKTLKGLTSKVLPKSTEKKVSVQKNKFKPYQPEGAYQVVDRKLEVPANLFRSDRDRQ